MTAPSGRAWLARRPDTVSWALCAAHVAVVVAAVPLAAWTGPSRAVVALWLWLGLTMNSLLNLMHECAHRLAFRRRGSNDVVGRWVLGPLALADFDAYRQRHWAHHKNLGLATDTKDAYLVEIGGSGMARLLLRCLTLQEAARKLSQQRLAPAGDEQPLAARGAALARTAAVQAALAGAVLVAAAAGHDGTRAIVTAALVAYGFTYLYGLGSLTVFAATLRAIAEHQTGEDGTLDEGRAALRNFRTGPVTRLVFGAYGFADHATHHRRPSVPHYRLAEVTAALAAAEPGLEPRAGYVATLRRLRREHVAAAAGADLAPGV